MVSKRNGERKRILPGAILAAFIAAMATFFLMLSIEKDALSAYEKVSVWCTVNELPKGLEITANSLEDCFVQVEIDKTKVPDRMIENPRDLIGKQTEILISQGTILTNPMFTEEGKFKEGLFHPIIVGCKGDDLFQLVSGVLRKGDSVHIYTVNEELKETYLLWENIKVYQAFDVSGNMIASEDIITPAARVNLLLEEGYAEQFYNELNSGSLRLVKVWE